MIGKFAAVGLALALSACATSDIGRARSVQAFAGSSSAPVATAIVEAMAGGLVGRSVGSELDRRDRRRALEAEYRALEYTPAGQAVAWGASPQSSGEVVAGSPYRVGSQNCRQYTHTIYTSGRTRTARGSACRNPDGSWTPLA